VATNLPFFRATQPPHINIRFRVWIEAEHAIAFAAAEPATDGHILIAPKKHVFTVYQLSIAEQKAIWALVVTFGSGCSRGSSLTGLASASRIRSMKQRATHTCISTLFRGGKEIGSDCRKASNG
jgi:diadenosine tetraphosphate (Ap4A) HIT family hydrolase